MPPPQDSTAIEPWPLQAQSPMAMWGLSDAVLRLRVFVHQDDPNFHLRSVIKFGEGRRGSVTAFRIIVPQSEVAKAMASANAGIGVHPDKMARFIKDKRKLSIWANLSDQLLTPYMSVNYYRRMAEMYGGYPKLQDTVRPFLLPDINHCSMSGCGPQNFDALTAIENWADKGDAPDSETI